MSLDLSAIVSSAFQTVGATINGISKSITYRHYSGSQVYDPVTGTLTSTTTDYNLTGVIFVGYTRKEKEYDLRDNRKTTIEFGDMKCLIPYAKLSIQPTSEDVIIEGSNTWRVVDFSADPTGAALYTFQVRLS